MNFMAGIENSYNCQEGSIIPATDSYLYFPDYIVNCQEGNKMPFSQEGLNKLGFDSYTQYLQDRRHKLGRSKPMSENKECAAYLGVHIAETVLSKIFHNVKRMPVQFSGYDFVCGKGFKVDVKCSVLTDDTRNHRLFRFNIRKNIFADYFLLLAFDNRECLTPLHLWLINGDELVGVNGEYKKPLNSKKILTIHNTLRSLKIYEQYEQTEKLNKLQCLCNGEHHEK